jgi:hypothetical protein
MDDETYPMRDGGFFDTLYHGYIKCGPGSRGTIFCMITYDSAGGSGVVDQAFASADGDSGVSANSFLLPAKSIYQFHTGLRDAKGSPEIRFTEYKIPSK